MKFLLSLTLLIIASLSSKAQDYIHLHTGEVIECKVTFIGIHTVRYREVVDFSLELEIEKSKIEEISLENGRTYKYEAEPLINKNPEALAQQGKNVIKIGLLTPIWGAVRLEYERSLRERDAVFGSVSIIGVQIGESEDFSGLGLSAGYKFYRSFTTLDRMRTPNLLQGLYIMPEVAFSKYNVYQTYSYYDNTTFGWENGTSTIYETGIATLLNIGYQNVVDDAFTIDFCIGIGYGYVDTRIIADDGTSPSYSSPFAPYDGHTMFNFYLAGNDVPVAFKTRISIGYKF